MNYTEAEKIVMPIALIAIIIIGFILRIFLKNKSDKIKNIPLTAIIVVMLVLELVKQIRLIANGAWTYWNIPIHFCSSFMIWFSVAQFGRGRVKEIGQACSLSSGILMTIMFYIYPSSIIGNACANPFANFSTFHTFTFHFLAICYWVWLVMLNLYKPNKNDLWICAIVYFVYYIILTAMAYIFNTNFSNALQSNINFMEQFRLTCGQIPYTIVMFLFGIGAIVAILAIYMGLQLCASKKSASTKDKLTGENYE